MIYQQTQIPDYAELIVKFLDALIDTYLPGIDEETSEESLRTPTSPYPPPVQSQLSITANLNLSNSMTSLATSQHSPGQEGEGSFTHSALVPLVTRFNQPAYSWEESQSKQVALVSMSGYIDGGVLRQRLFL